MNRNVYVFPIIFIIFLTFLAEAHSLSAYEDSSHPTSEEILRQKKENSELFDEQLPRSDLHILRHTRFEEKNFLSPRLRMIFDTRDELKNEIIQWERITDLKRDILALTPTSPIKSTEISEAEAIAITTIQTLEKTKKEFGMLKPAALNNIFVNMKLKKDGLCWHWARALMVELEKIPLKAFQFHWVTAYQGKLREHNAIAVYPANKTFHDGIVLDGWRKAGKPYWGLVSKDHYPWEWGDYAEDDQNDHN